MSADLNPDDDQWIPSAAWAPAAAAPPWTGPRFLPYRPSWREPWADDPTAQRAAEVLRDHADEPALYAVAALMADPDLLVDLAIEAGALVSVAEEIAYWIPCDCDDELPLYLRREAPDA